MTHHSTQPSTVAGAAVDHAPLLERLFENAPAPAAYRLDRIEGEVPPYVRGTYYLNGPAHFRRGERAYRHWLDGDGRVSALAFGEDGVHFTSRWVESRRHRAEEEAGRLLYRAFGTAFPGDRLERGVGLASPVNVSAYRWGGSLLAFGEQGLPCALDPKTLRTLGEESFGKLSPVSPFSAHPGFDPDSGEMVNFGLSYAARRPALHLYRFVPGRGLVERRRVELPHPYSVHDFSLTPSWAVFHLAPHLLDMAALLDRGASVQEALCWKPELGSRLLLVPRDPDRPPRSLPVGDGYCLHHINAYEEGERLIVDLLELPEPVYPQYEPMPELFQTVPPARPTRLVVDPERERLLERQATAFPLAADFPAVDPRQAGRPYRSFWMLAISATAQPGRKFFDQVVAYDWGLSASGPDRWEEPGGRPNVPGTSRVYQAEAFRYLGGEPVFVGHPEDPDRGVLICQEIDAGSRRGAFLLLDAFDVAAGPIARLHLEEPIPPGFHASFAPEEPRR